MSNPCTLGELREMTADLPDDVELIVLAPVSATGWRTVGADVSVHLAPGPSQIWIELDEWTEIV